MNRIQAIAESKTHYGGMTLVQRMQECHTPAVSIALIENFALCETRTYGVKRKGAQTPADAGALFQAASISKPVFAAAVMRLVQRGVVEIDGDISQFLGAYGMPAYGEKAHTLTFRQLLSHHAGFNLHGFAGYRQGQRIPTEDQRLRGAFPANHPRLKRVKEPETEFMYSGGGYMLAQAIITQLWGRDFCGLMDELVFAPLSMASSTYAQPLPKARLGEIAYGYDDHNLQIPGGYYIMPELSAAGMWTTPTDLARFGIEIMKALKSESAFLDKPTAEVMTTPAYKNAPYGVGFAVGTCKKGSTFGHGGSNVGYHANMVFCPQNGSGVVVMQNADIGAEIPGEVTSAFKELSGW